MAEAPAPSYVGLAHRHGLFGWEAQPLESALLRDLSTAPHVDIAVAFILERGILRIEPYLQDVLDRGGRVRILTGDYLDCTEPQALERLLDLAPRDPGGPGTIVRRVLETSRAIGFHPKAYLISGCAAYVGSSNLSSRALNEGVKWNLRVEDPSAIAALSAGGRGGWDAHVGSYHRHPDWHPELRDPERRRALFRIEFGTWFH